MEIPLSQKSYTSCTFFVLIHLLIVTSQNEVVQGDLLGQEYHQPCDSSRPCNGVKFLECQNGICECIAKNEIIYDQQTNQCSALVGYSCLRSIPGQANNNQASARESLEQKVQYHISCVPNAKCSFPEDICQCDFRYYKGQDNKCLKQKGYGEKCYAEDQCDKLKSLSCIGGTCSCDKSHLYDRKNDRCIVVIGSECTNFHYMTSNLEHYSGNECPEDALCKVPDGSADDKGVCECKEGFIVTSDKTCGRDYGDECNVDRKCSDIEFICRNGTCQCKYPVHQYYDEESESCVSLAGGPCDSTVTKCAPNAYCHEESPHKYCKCQSGYIEDNDGNCVKAYGTTCEFDEECDPIPSLACIDNSCSCPDKLQIYNDKARICISLVGGRCKKDVNSTAAVCPQNAYCIKAYPQLTYGRCLCTKGMTTTSSRLCTK